MNQHKRTLNLTPSIDVTLKKRRSELCLSSPPTRSCLENLSNELFYEVFDYLDSCDVYNAFCKLNKRFEDLLSCSSIPIKVDFNLMSNSLVEHRCRHVIIPSKNRLLSLHLRNETLIDQFFTYCTLDSSFSRLQSIVLGGLTDHKLLWILFYLNSLPCLSSLTICIEDEYYSNLGDIYRLIFSLPALNYNKLSLLCYEEMDLIVPNIINEKFSSIKYLHIDYSCTIEQLTALLFHTPQLCSLTCERLIDPDENVKRDLSITLSHLRYISIDACFIDYDEFEAFIQTISSQLQVLRINIIWNATYLDANRWEQLIKNHMPHLNKFYFNYEQYTDKDFSIDPSYAIIDRFTSSFWRERKWLLELKLNCREVFFSIHPYRKEQFDSSVHMKIDTYPIRLIFEGDTTTEQIRSFINKVKSSGIKVPLTYLNMNCKSILSASLFEIILLLPQLRFLEISSLSNLHSGSSFIENIKNQLLGSVMNKIITVKLHNFTEKRQLQCLINLCSHIQYLEVDCISSTDLGMVIRYILTNQVTHTPNLSFVCLNIPNAHEKMIQKLTRIIDLETLVTNYTIQRIGNKIFLQWRLE